MKSFRLSARVVRGVQLHSQTSKLRQRIPFSTCSRFRLSESLTVSPKETTDTVHIRWTNSNKSSSNRHLEDHGKSSSAQNHPTIEYVKVDGFEPFHPIYLRDSCVCPLCVDSSTKQKNFQTTDIPADIKAKSVEVMDSKGLKITWENDIPGFSLDHVSEYPKQFLHIHSSPGAVLADLSQGVRPRLWNGKRIKSELEYINFVDYMTNDKALYRALRLLNVYGLLLLREVPESENSVEQIASRIGTIRDTFYGRTWDVKSVPQAKNVAYTHQFLGLHMDLLYMANPPGFQLLHCLKNTCKGGASLFSDSFNAARVLPSSNVDMLSKAHVAYQYRNAGEHYYFRHPVIEFSNRLIATPSGPKRDFRHINYSPPFQAPHLVVGKTQTTDFGYFLSALKRFANRVEAKENLLEYRLQEGECVLFNNRRILHGRRAFEAAAGERWLKGTYIDTDVFMSRFRVLNEAFRTDSKLKYRKGKLVFEAPEFNGAEPGRPIADESLGNFTSR